MALLQGQASGSQEQLRTAQQYFQVVGSSPSECDTIPGRQAMASCFFLLKQFDDVLVFLSVSAYALSCVPTVCMRNHIQQNAAARACDAMVLDDV